MIGRLMQIVRLVGRWVRLKERVDRLPHWVEREIADFERSRRRTG
jgi:hypothetical protein